MPTVPATGEADAQVAAHDTGSSFHRAALIYATQGWPVFPLLPGAKTPATRHGFHEAETDPGFIRLWWADGTPWNIGIATGPAGLVVIDADPGGSIRSMCASRELPPTFAVCTPRGGLHLYYRALPGCPVRNSAGRLAPHIDVRAEGGYVAGAGSVVDGRSYTVGHLADPVPLPGWLAEAAAEPLEPRRVPSRAGGRGTVAGLIRFVSRLPEGRRNTGLYWACRRAIDMNRADGIPLLVTAVTRTGLDTDEAWRTAASAERAVS